MPQTKCQASISLHKTNIKECVENGKKFNSSHKHYFCKFLLQRLCAATWEFFSQVEQSDAQISLNLEPQQGCSFQS